MVVPSLLIVALDVGRLRRLARCSSRSRRPAVSCARAPASTGWRRWALVAAAVVVAVVGVELPVRHGVQARHGARACSRCPLCAYAFGRLADLPFPGPALLSVASVLFLFDRNFTIYGGNVASTLAGEFAFSISLSLALLYLGVVIARAAHRASTAPSRRCCSPSPACAT